MSKFFHSIRWRVQVWHGAILLVVILAFCFTAYRLVWSNQMRSVDRAIGHADHTLMHALIQRTQTSDGGHDAFSPERMVEQLRRNPDIPPEAAAIFSGTEPGYLYFSMCDAQGRVLLQSPNTPKDDGLWRGPFNDINEDTRIRNGRREIVHGMPEGVRTIFGMELGLERQEMRRFAISIGAVGLAVWSLGLLGGWWIAGRAIKSIATISKTATRIADGNLSERISTKGTDSELDQLGHVLNDTFSRLHGAFERQKQFTADASHELRTPVTILLAETQRILKRERTAEEYRGVLQTCQATATRMGQLIESMLLLARQDSTGAERVRERCDLATILRETAAQIQPIAAARGLEIFQALESAPCLGDRAALSILATNILANAIQHHDRKSGTIHLVSGVQESRAFFVVRDDGPGIPPADLPNIFERFYRADAARTDGTEHAGLGLAIAKTIVKNHEGVIVAENLPERGCGFTIRLPLAKA